MEDMNYNLNQLALIKKFWSHLSARRQTQSRLLILLMVISMFSEVLGVGAVIPFLGVLTSPEKIFAYDFMNPIIQLLGLTQPSQLLLPFTLFFIIVTFIAAMIRLLLLYAVTRFSFGAGADLSIDIYRRTLYQKYEIHMDRNSSEVINGIVKKTDILVYNLLMPIVTLFGSVILLVGVMVLLLMTDVVMAVSAFLGFGLIYLGIVKLTSFRLIQNSESIAHESTKVIKSLQEGLGGIRDVLIDGTQEFYCQIYRSSDLRLRRAQGDNQFISGSPRFLIEALGIILIASLSFIQTQRDGGVMSAIPVLGALAVGAARMLPAMQQIFGAFTQVRGSQESLKDVLDLLDQPIQEPQENTSLPSVTFVEKITLKNAGFRYSDSTPWVLNNISINISRGERIGVMGATGSGKSTLLDILMGLLQPSEGELKVDNNNITQENLRSWQSHVAHVPQAIFLADSSIEENIALGVPKESIDRALVREVAYQAQLIDLIECWPQKYQTRVGERGVKLSGGQRQRIGIARALYKQADVIIFDEATSALDNSTESAVMKAIDGLNRDLNIIIIAHRLTTLKGCDVIFELDKGGISRQGKYGDLVASES